MFRKTLGPAVLAAIIALAPPGAADEDTETTSTTPPCEENQQPSTLCIGPVSFPDDYEFPGSAYLFLDKPVTQEDATIVFRDGGNARAEIGLQGDNDIHFKLATGEYLHERFIDAMIIRADSGFVDAVDKLRSFSTTGKPILVIGNSDGLTAGAGIEAEYDQVFKQGNIRVIERGNTYRPLVYNAQTYSWHVGNGVMNRDAAVAIPKSGTLDVYNGIHILSNTTYGGGQFGQGMIYKDPVNGLVLSSIEGRDYDFLLANRSGWNVFGVSAGTQNMEVFGTLELSSDPAAPGEAATKRYVDATVKTAAATRPIVVEPGNRTITAGDSGGIIEGDRTTRQTFVFDGDSQSYFPGLTGMFVQRGEGRITILARNGITLRKAAKFAGNDGSAQTDQQESVVTWYFRDATTVVVSGDLELK